MSPPFPWQWAIPEAGRRVFVCVHGSWGTGWAREQPSPSHSPDLSKPSHQLCHPKAEGLQSLWSFVPCWLLNGKMMAGGNISQG